MQRKGESTAGKSSIENAVIWKDGSQLLIASVWWNKNMHCESLNVFWMYVISCAYICIVIMVSLQIISIVKWYTFIIYTAIPSWRLDFETASKRDLLFVRFSPAVIQRRKLLSPFVTQAGSFQLLSYLLPVGLSLSICQKKHFLACLKNLFDMCLIFSVHLSTLKTPKPFWEE